MSEEHGKLSAQRGCGRRGETRHDSNSTLRRHTSYAADVRDAEIRDAVRGLTKVEQVVQNLHDKVDES